MPKVVVNSCFGGFGLSHQAIMRYSELANINLVCQMGIENHYITYYKDGVISDDNYFSTYDIERDDPILVQVVEEMGVAANGDFADLRIAVVPDDIDWYVDDYDGNETVREAHRTW